jgi:hypothetical protein
MTHPFFADLERNLKICRIISRRWVEARSAFEPHRSRLKSLKTLTVVTHSGDDGRVTQEVADLRERRLALGRASVATVPKS